MLTDNYLNLSTLGGQQFLAFYNKNSIEAAVRVQTIENNKWKVLRTIDKKENNIKGTKKVEGNEKKLYPIFYVTTRKVEIAEPKLTINQNKAIEFNDSEDAHCIEAAEKIEQLMGGGPP